jgi:hypothetical protein
MIAKNFGVCLLEAPTDPFIFLSVLSIEQQVLRIQSQVSDNVTICITKHWNWFYVVNFKDRLRDYACVLTGNFNSIPVATCGKTRNELWQVMKTERWKNRS